jgi:asparagine synthase (glutamine-hydrolysing)
MPIALTFRYANEPKTEESEWQELVVRHVGVDDWETLDMGTDHDVVGAPALEFLLSHGLVFPAGLPAKIPLLLRCRGGSVMSGEGGDEIFGARRATALKKLLDKPPRLLRRHFQAELVRSVGPRRARAALYRKGFEGGSLEAALSYLRPRFLHQVLDDVALDLASEPFSNTQSLAWHLRRKIIVKHQENLTALAVEHDVQHLDPFLEPKFVGAYARMLRPLGFLTRTEAMLALFSDLLPKEVLQRQSKAVFNRAVLTGISKSFAKSWQGGGVDPDLVDPEALRSAWLSDWPPWPSRWLMQAAWLHEHSGTPYVQERPA